MALNTLAEWTGSTIIGNLVDTAFSYMYDRMLPADTEAELNRLKTALPKITAVLSVAEALKLKYPNSGVDAWLQQFNMAFLAAEDVLDELNYRDLEHMVKDQDKVGGFFFSIVGSLKRKFCGTNINSDTLGRLREAIKMLDQASNDVGHFYKFSTGLKFCNPLETPCEVGKVSCRETTSFLTESKVVGREIEKGMIIEWLKKPVPHTCISALCIVGAGGLGKTTLAQLISEKMRRENYFDKILWVCVSTFFCVEAITRKILEQLGEGNHGGKSLNALQIKLKENIHSKRVLFILDDVWNEDKMCDWEKLLAPLKFVQEGSKILVTTRMRSVADMLARVLNVDRECLDLRGLDEQQLLLLLNKYAFHGYNMDKHKDLQKIGNKIIQKLWGSPLAAKVIGSLLNSNMNFHFWKRILKCNSLINLEQAKEVADVLKLSYYHLSAALQQCFRFCSIFPQDYLFEKNTLIRMWMASGFIQKQSWGEERPEDIGEDYFNHLLGKSFFEPHTQDKGENYYVMHDMMHELAEIVSKGECFRVNPSNNSLNIPSTAQHVSVPFCEIERVFHLKNLRTLVITMLFLYEMPTYNDRFVLPCDSLKETLRVLSINVNFNYELPEEIDHLIHLRILEANEVSGTFLANSICKLYHLEVLDLMDVNSNFSGVETTGVRITNLVNLRYMNIPDEIMINVYGVHKLTSLQELTFFVGHDSGRHIDELKTLNNLRHLCIKQIENITDPAEVKTANLFKKGSLLSLSLNWTEGISDNPEQIIDNLQPHPNLRELEIDYYNGHRSPIWMRDLPSLNLSSLMLSNCPLWEDLPFLAQMPHLKNLSLLGMSEVKQVDFSFDITKNAYAFPSLEQLICDEMPKWQSWAGLLSCHGFPNLEVLKVTNCSNLTELPAMPLSLFYFKVENVGLKSLPDIYHNYSITTPSPSYPKSSLTEVILRYCPNLKSMNGFLQQENLDFQAVETLVIDHCENLVRLPTSAFGKLVSLKYLYIRGCPKLVPVDNQRILLPVTLQTLIIGD